MKRELTIRSTSQSVYVDFGKYPNPSPINCNNLMLEIENDRTTLFIDFKNANKKGLNNDYLELNENILNLVSIEIDDQFSNKKLYQYLNINKSKPQVLVLYLFVKHIFSINAEFKNRNLFLTINSKLF